MSRSNDPSLHPPPWYREPWVWLLIMIPMTAVLAGLVTVYLAVTTRDGLVVDDYYQHGKTINRVLERDRAAARYGLRAEIDFDAASESLALRVAARDYDMPSRLQLSILHPTQAGRDQRVPLVHQGEGYYRGSYRALSDGSWYVQLEADDWRLSGRILVPQSRPDILLPAENSP